MKMVFLTLALMSATLLSAQNKPLIVHFLPIFSAGKSQNTQTNVGIGNTSISKSKEKSSKQIKTKNVMRFGEYAVSEVSFNTEEVEMAVSHFLKYVTSKIQTNSVFTVNAASKKAVVTTSDKVRVEALGSVGWTDLLVPFKAQLVQTGVIKIDTLHWEYFVEDNHFINNTQEQLIGYLSNGKNKIEIKIHHRMLVFYNTRQKIATLKFPLFKDTTITLEESLDADTKLAITAVCSAALLKIRGIQQAD